MDHDHVDKKLAVTFGVTEVLSSLVLIALVGIFSTFKWKLRNLEKAAAKIPGPPTLPIVGNALLFLGSSQDMFSRFYSLAQYGTLSRFWLGPVLVIYVGKPEYVQIVLNSRHALEKSTVYKFLKEFTRDGLATAPAEKWRKHRRVIQPVFNSKLLEDFILVFNKYNNNLVEKLKPHVDGGIFDILNYIAILDLDIICETALGIDKNTPAHFKAEFNDANHFGAELLAMRSYKLWLHPDFIYNMAIRLWYGSDMKEKLLEKTFRLPEMIIKQKKEEYKLKKEKESHTNNECNAEPERKSKVFIDVLLELSDAGANFSDDDLRDEVLTMILAGYNTTAQTNCFTVLMLAIHQDVQEKVYEEMFKIFGDSDRDATMDDLKQMLYTEMVIKETMRRFPTVPVFMRTVTQDIDLTDHKLPAGCTVAVCPLAMHMDPNLYPKPEMFNPENFTPENIAARHPYSYVPFSAGPRNCVGLRHAMLSMKTTVAVLVRNYRLYAELKMEDLKLRADLFLRNDDGYPVRIVNRK